MASLTGRTGLSGHRDTKEHKRMCMFHQTCVDYHGCVAIVSHVRNHGEVCAVYKRRGCWIVLDKDSSFISWHGLIPTMASLGVLASSWLPKVKFLRCDLKSTSQSESYSITEAVVNRLSMMLKDGGS